MIPDGGVVHFRFHDPVFCHLCAYMNTHLCVWRLGAQVLNKARSRLPTEPLIWITAAQLEESNGDASRLDALFVKGW